LRSEVQPVQTNVSTTNAVTDSSSPVQTQLLPHRFLMLQLPAVHNNNDIG